MLTPFRTEFCESEEPYYLDAKRIKTNIFVNDGISDYALPISAVSNNPINMVRRSRSSSRVWSR